MSCEGCGVRFWEAEWYDTSLEHLSDMEDNMLAQKWHQVIGDSYLLAETSCKTVMAVLRFTYKEIKSCSHRMGEITDEIAKRIGDLPHNIKETTAQFSSDIYVHSRYPTEKGSPRKRATQEEATRLYRDAKTIHEWSRKILSTHL